MNKTFKIIAFSIVILAIIHLHAKAQAQMKNWLIAPNIINVETNFVSVAPILGSPATATQIPNGVYDSNNDLLFYISDATVYDNNNTIIGQIPSGGAEICIVPFGTNDNSSSSHCNLKYNIFSTLGGTTDDVVLYQSVLDINSYSLSSKSIDSLPFGTEFGAIAVGKVKIPTLQRYIYFLAGSGYADASGMIRKLIINLDGTVGNAVDVYPTATVTNSLAGIDVFSRELDLSPDGQWLAWAGYTPNSANPTLLIHRYHYIKLDANGDLDFATYGTAAYQEFNLGAAITWPSYDNFNNAGFRGVEFFQKSSPTGGTTTTLYVGAGNDGIYAVDVAISYNVNQILKRVNGSFPSFGFSQIELAYNGNMYASSSSNTQVGAFSPNAMSPLIQPTPLSFLFTNPPKASYTIAGAGNISHLYTLPDQIDGEDYSLITPSPMPSLVTVNTANFPTNTSTNQSATWSYGNNPFNNASNPIHVLKELRIRQNSHLIINNMTFKFSPDAKVIIEPGSSLTLNNTTFTSTYIGDPCDVPYTWEGVQVWGASQESQNSIPLKQGKLVLKNFSKIKYARIGSRNWDGVNKTKTGGIIIGNTNSSFENCYVGVEFKPYKNMVGTKEYANKSSFSNVIFKNSFVALNNYPFSSAPNHIIIEGCVGITVADCFFLNDNSQTMFNFKSRGIKAIDSYFTIRNTQFDNLFHGIDASCASINKTFNVIGCTFNNNQTGIYANNVNYLNILQNTFNIGNNLKSNASTQVGINTNLCSGFRIEENHFNLSSPNITTVSKWGILTYRCGASANEIYLNYFNNIDIGNYASGINKDPNNPSLSGLQFLCNQNQLNDDYDFFVSSKAGSNAGIRLFQGSSALSAGNTFSNTGPFGSFSDFFNEPSNQSINYYCKIPNAPIYYNAPYIAPTPVAQSNSCPSKICTIPPCDNQLLSVSRINQLESIYDTAETAYLNLLYSYNQLIDGGNTNALLSQIQQSWSSNALALRDELLSISPYLSQNSLREAANSNILPAAMLLMICLANPDATKGDGFLYFLQNEIQNPLPAYMIELIVASWDDATNRTLLENMLADFNVQMALNSNEILKDCHNKLSLDENSIDLNDTTDYVELKQMWLNRIQTLSAKYDLVETYFEKGDYQNAENVLNNLSTNFHLTDLQQQELDDYNFFYLFRKTLDQNGRNLSELDSTEIFALTNFTQGENNIAKGLAQNALCHYYNICIEDDYSLNSGARVLYHHSYTPSSLQTDPDNPDDKINISVAPNPATSIAIFEYSLQEEIENAILSVLDISGKEIATFELNHQQGRINWNTSLLQSGLYYYYVTVDNIRIVNGKITVKK